MKFIFNKVWSGLRRMINVLYLYITRTFIIIKIRKVQYTWMGREENTESSGLVLPVMLIWPRFHLNHNWLSSMGKSALHGGSILGAPLQRYRRRPTPLPGEDSLAGESSDHTLSCITLKKIPQWDWGRGNTVGGKSFGSGADCWTILGLLLHGGSSHCPIWRHKQCGLGPYFISLGVGKKGHTLHTHTIHCIAFSYQ